MIYTRCWDRHIYALDATNGQTVWQHKAPRDYSSDLWVDEKYLYIGVKDYQGGVESGPRAYALYILDWQTGQRVSRYEVQGHILARPVATEGAVLFATDDRSREIDSQGTLYALDTRHPQNQQLLWEPCVVEQRFQSDLLLVGDVVIAGTRQGAVYAIRWQAAETIPETPSVYIARGAWEDAAIAHALRGEYVQAAEIYAQQLEQPLRAGWLYFHAGEHRRVIELLGQSEVEAEKALAIGAVHALPEAKERARILRDMGECLVAANAYKEAGDWVGAGDCYREAQVWEEARAAYAQAGAWEQWSELSNELEKWEDLVNRYLQTGEYAQAAEIYTEKLGLFLEAADCYDRANLLPEAFAAYRRVNPERMTEAAQRRLADLAEEMDEVDVALETYQALGELAKAAHLAETSGRYEQALALYQEIGLPIKVAEMLEQLTRYAEAAQIFEQEKDSARAAENLCRQAGQEIERVGIRYVGEQVEAWLDQAMVLFEEEEAFADEETKQSYYREQANLCRVRLMQIRREPLLQVSLQSDSLIYNQGNAVNYMVKNVGWGTARNLTLTVSGGALQPIEPLFLGDLKSGRQREGTLSVVPQIAGALTLRVELRGQARRGDLFQSLTEVVQVAHSSDWLADLAAEGQSINLNIQHTGPGEQSLKVSEPPGWDDSDSDVADSSDVVSQRQLEVDSLCRQLAQHHSNLNKLKEDATIYGAGEVPLRLQNQIEAEQQAIAEIEERLNKLEK
jgi:tetratricopeptide (TPR) repeat protein